MTSADQDLHTFLTNYRGTYPDDVLIVKEPVTLDQDITAVVWELADGDRHPLLWFTNVEGSRHDIVTNLFASRARIARILGTDEEHLHESFQRRVATPQPLAMLDDGPILANVVTGDDVDLARLPLVTHFATDRGPYITSGIVLAEQPVSGIGNLSYHRATPIGRNRLATSLHSRGDLWRILAACAERGEPMKVAMIIGGHPLFMLAASARVPATIDERNLAGALFGGPLEVVRTPIHGLAVPATADVVFEGTIDPDDDADEGPFGEFTGYSSDRSTRNVITVDAVLARSDAVWVDVVGGNSAEHLNLARVPREAELIEKLRDRFPCVQRVHYPNSGTHFHCYVAVRQRRPGEARQVLLALLGWEPYLKTAVAVDDDVDITDDRAVLWALATHFQPADDLFTIDGLPGSPLDPSSTIDGTTSRLALDATRRAGFEGTRIAVAADALDRARRLLRA
jgi:UbiD family decarboxylase